MKLNVPFVLCGPQAIGKTINSKQIASLLGCDRIIDDWNGKSPIPEGAFAITNEAYQLPPCGVGFYVENLTGIMALIQALSPTPSDDKNTANDVSVRELYRAS